jgi:hypothetical protein
MIAVWALTTLFFQAIWGIYTVLSILILLSEPGQKMLQNIGFLNEMAETLNYASAFSGYWVFAVFILISTLILPSVDISLNETFYDDIELGSA